MVVGLHGREWLLRAKFSIMETNTPMGNIRLYSISRKPFFAL